MSHKSKYWTRTFCYITATIKYSCMHTKCQIQCTRRSNPIISNPIKHVVDSIVNYLLIPHYPLMPLNGTTYLHWNWRYWCEGIEGSGKVKVLMWPLVEEQQSPHITYGNKSSMRGDENNLSSEKNWQYLWVNGFLREQFCVSILTCNEKHQ